MQGNTSTGVISALKQTGGKRPFYQSRWYCQRKDAISENYFGIARVCVAEVSRVKVTAVTVSVVRAGIKDTPDVFRTGIEVCINSKEFD